MTAGRPSDWKNSTVPAIPKPKTFNAKCARNSSPRQTRSRSTPYGAVFGLIMVMLPCADRGLRSRPVAQAELATLRILLCSHHPSADYTSGVGRTMRWGRRDGPSEGRAHAIAPLARKPFLVLVPIGRDDCAFEVGGQFFDMERALEVLWIFRGREDVAIVGLRNGDVLAQALQAARSELQCGDADARNLPFPLLDA